MRLDTKCDGCKKKSYSKILSKYADTFIEHSPIHWHFCSQQIQIYDK